MKSLADLWSEGKCPIVNGILFPEGRIEEIEPIDDVRPSGVLFLKHGGSRIVTGHDPQECTVVSSGRPELKPGQTCATDAGRDMAVLCGEGFWGGEGFVALTGMTGALRWIAYFDFSNPFVGADLFTDEVVAHNNHGESWRFPLSRPWAVTIEAPQRARRTGG